jgi:hypothetical protein
MIAVDQQYVTWPWIRQEEWGHSGATSMDPWKQELVAPQAAATELPVNGLAQWVCFVHDRWQEKSLRESRTSHMKIFLEKFPF